jgi:hypothetical protein
MLAPSALAAGAARLRQAMRAYSRRCKPAACAASLRQALRACRKCKNYFFFFFAVPPAGDRTSSRLRRAARNARAFGARSRRCAPAAGAVRLPQALRAATGAARLLNMQNHFLIEQPRACGARPAILLLAISNLNLPRNAVHASTD